MPSFALVQMTSAYSTGRAFMPLPGSLIDVLEYKVSPLVAAVSQTSEKVQFVSAPFPAYKILAALTMDVPYILQTAEL